MALQLVEVARGRLKPLARCTPAELRRAKRHEAHKALLMERWTELVQVLGPEWIPQTKWVTQIGSGDLPTHTTVPEWEAEVETLEFVAEFKDGMAGRSN